VGRTMRLRLAPLLTGPARRLLRGGSLPMEQGRSSLVACVQLAPSSHRTLDTYCSPRARNGLPVRGDPLAVAGRRACRFEVGDFARRRARWPEWVAGILLGWSAVLCSVQAAPGRQGGAHGGMGPAIIVTPGTPAARAGVPAPPPPHGRPGSSRAAPGAKGKSSGAGGSTAPAGSATPSTPPTPTLKPDWKPHAGLTVDLGDRKRVYVGDPFTVVVTVIARAEVAVNLPTSLHLGPFSQLGQAEESRETLDNGKVKHVFRFRVAGYQVGDLKLGPIPVTYVPPRRAFAQGMSDPTQAVPALVLAVPAVTQTVSSVMANEPSPQLKKNAPPMPIMVEDRRLKIALIVIAALLLGALLGAIAYWLYRRRKRTGPPPPPLRPAHEIALEKLAAVREAGFLERGEMKEFYLGVSEAVREYLGNRYGFDSLELTTSELEDEMRSKDLTGITHRELLHFLGDCDLVKFAKYIPPLEEAERSFAQAEHIVHATKFVAPEAPQDATASGSGGSALQQVQGQSVQEPERGEPVRDQGGPRPGDAAQASRPEGDDDA